MGKFVDHAFYLMNEAAHECDHKSIPILSAAIGAAAINLDATRQAIYSNPHRCAEGKLQDCISLIRVIRNAYAPDISEPKLNLNDMSLRKNYDFEEFSFDLTNENGEPICIETDRVVEILNLLKHFYEQHY